MFVFFTEEDPFSTGGSPAGWSDVPNRFQDQALHNMDERKDADKDYPPIYIPVHGLSMNNVQTPQKTQCKSSDMEKQELLNLIEQLSQEVKSSEVKSDARVACIEAEWSTRLARVEKRLALSMQVLSTLGKQRLGSHSSFCTRSATQ